jgi:hypothetical protein
LGISIEKGKHSGEVIKSTCGRCRQSTRHEILSDVDLSGRDDAGEEFIFGWDDSYQIIQCQGCEFIIFRKTHMNSEDMGYVKGEDGWEPEYLTREELYPNPEETRVSLSDDHLLPENLYRIYSETLGALNSGSPVLTGIGIRAIIETVCKDKKATGRDLNDRINDLVGQGVLTTEGAEILHKLRVLGNAAAHEVKPHSSTQLGLAFDVVEHLLQGVYILPHHAKQEFK